jgi:Dihydrofolate reductase
MTASIAMIAAVARNGVIGHDQDIPWRIPSDFAFFKRTTMGKPMVMGRKQYETVGKPLPGRTNIIVTGDAGFKAEGTVVVHALDEALRIAREIADRDSVDEIMIIGGGTIYEQMMPKADRLYISHVELEPEGNIRFPDIDPDIWQVVAEPEVTPDPRDAASYRVKVYERRAASAH